MKRKKLNWNICGFLGSLLLGVLWACSGVSFSTTFFDDLFVAMFVGSLLGGFFIYPFGLTLLNLSYFFRKPELPVKGAERKTEIITLTLGIIYTLLYDTMNSSSTSGISPINCIILGVKRIWHTAVEWQNSEDGRCVIFMINMAFRWQN